jgi:hypothetical protein
MEGMEGRVWIDRTQGEEEGRLGKAGGGRGNGRKEGGNEEGPGR